MANLKSKTVYENNSYVIHDFDSNCKDNSNSKIQNEEDPKILPADNGTESNSPHQEIFTVTQNDETVTKAETSDAIKKPLTNWGFIKRYKYQIKLICCLSLMYFITGSVQAYPSVIIADLENYNTTIYGNYIDFTDTQLDLLASLVNIGSIVGVVISGSLMGVIGRKPVMGILTTMGGISWIGIILSPNANYILAFRVIGGAAVGGAGVVRIAYIVETNDEVSRPIFTQIAATFLTVGQLLSTIPSYWLRYYAVAIINLIYPALFLLSLFFILPESPTFLTIKGREEEAVKVVKKLGVADTDVKKVMDTYKAINKSVQEVDKWQALTRPDVLKKLGMLLCLITINIFTGYQIYLTQTARILLDAGNDLDPTLSTLLSQAAMIIGIIVMIPFVKRVGRRGCLLLSLSVTFVGIFSLAIFSLFYERSETAMSDGMNETYYRDEVVLEHTEDDLDLRNIIGLSVRWFKESVFTSMEYEDRAGDDQYQFVRNNGWIPLACVMVTQIGVGLGMQNVPFVLSSEYFPTAIRPLTASIAIGYNMLIGFVNIQLYSPMQEAMNMSGLLFFNSSICFIGIPFVYFFVVETIGKKVG